jgi:hypothetical protein
VPVPEEAPIVVMNAALLDAFHEHPAAVVIATVNSVPAAATGSDGALPTVNVHDGDGEGDGDGVGAVGESFPHATESVSRQARMAMRIRPTATEVGEF